MPLEELSHFAEKSGAVTCETPWGRWWQTVSEVHVEVNLPPNTRARDVVVNTTNNHIECRVHKDIIFKGRLYRTVHSDETVWTVEDKKTLTIVLAKADFSLKEEIWESLLEDGGFQPDILILHEMRKKIDLEKFQIENPGFDFSRAQLQKSYDRLPGWSTEAIKKQKEQQQEEGQGESGKMNETSCTEEKAISN